MKFKNLDPWAIGQWAACDIYIANSHLVRDQNWFFKVNFKSALNYSKLTV